MNSRKFYRILISLVLVFTICFGTCTSGFAATSGGSKYVKEMVISYGDTADEAKAWLTDNGYEVLDYNLNEGADDVFSTERAVYIGYKTTSDANEAITDMKLMNMKGGYSVQDYQMLLDEQKQDIKVFINNFKVAIQEYRDNYNKGQGRAVAAHDMLNALYDDDTQQYMGDLLLNKIREEYTDEEFAALSEEEQSKVADMTTILMQANANAVLGIEQVVATATDSGDDLWIERYENAKTYDEMVDELMVSKNLTVSEAEKKLAAEYDQDAKIIAGSLEDYNTYLANYTSADITLISTSDEIDAYESEHADFNYTNWYNAGTQQVVLGQLVNDDVSLLDLVTSGDYDIENDDRYMLYPLVASLTDGQRACLDFLSMYQLVSLGINDDESVEEAIESLDFKFGEDVNTSIYEGIDRSIFSDSVALTGEAYRLQSSTGENAVKGVTDYLSDSTKFLYAAFAVTAVASAASWGLSAYMRSLAEREFIDASMIENEAYSLAHKADRLKLERKIAEYFQTKNEADEVMKSAGAAYSVTRRHTTLMKFFRYAGLALTCVTIVMMCASLWSTYQDLQEYYNVDFTPIPSKMVNQGVDENDKKVYTYYSAVKCNRVAQGMVTDSTKLLGDYGDINGDVGRQWVALYTTTDKAAGNPITTDFTVQYNDTNIPNDDSTALSIFCESTAQNLTNEQAGYTYNDDKDGIYLFYGTDSSVFAGSVFTGGNYVLVGGISALVAAVIFFFIGRAVGRKKREVNA